MTEVFVLLVVGAACNVSGTAEKSMLLADKCRKQLVQCLDRDLSSSKLRKCLVAFKPEIGKQK